MFLLVSHLMNDLFAKNCPFKNKSAFDTPIYQSSISVFEGNISIVDGKLLVQDELSHIGWLPYANVKVSNKSEHQILRGKTVVNPLMLLGCEKYRANDVWGHKAFFCFNSNMIIDPKQKFFTKGSKLFNSKNVKTLVKEGVYRDMICPVINPLWKTKNFYGINIHRGPRQNDADWNYSLGCITVEQNDFDLFMKNIEYNEFSVYIHNIETVLRRPEQLSEIKNVSNDTINVEDLYRMINSRISMLRRNND